MQRMRPCGTPSSSRATLAVSLGLQPASYAPAHCVATHQHVVHPALSSGAFVRCPGAKLRQRRAAGASLLVTDIAFCCPGLPAVEIRGGARTIKVAD